MSDVNVSSDPGDQRVAQEAASGGSQTQSEQPPKRGRNQRALSEFPLSLATPSTSSILTARAKLAHRVDTAAGST